MGDGSTTSIFLVHQNNTVGTGGTKSQCRIIDPSLPRSSEPCTLLEKCGLKTVLIAF